jgi:hypothetical protein
MGLFGCKKRTTVEVPRSILEAKAATQEELLKFLNRYGEIETLQAAIKAEYTSEEKDYDQIELERYPKAPGHIFLKRPDSTFLFIQNPVLLKREISFLSVGDEFRVWIHGKSRFYIGKNSSKELVSDEMERSFKIPIRAAHLHQAILPETISLQDETLRVSKTEKEDDAGAYYILGIFRDTGTQKLVPLREFEIERVNLTVARQSIFGPEGKIEADIQYSDVREQEGFFLPGKIDIKRPLDGYNLVLELQDWRINPVIKEDVFKLDPPPGVEVIRFK